MDIKGIDRFIRNGLKRSHTVTFFGNHGIGKTSYTKYNVRALVAEKENVPIERVHVITKCVSIMDPADLLGNFHEFGGRTYNCPPNWIPVSKAYEDEMEALYKSYGMEYTRLTNYDDVYILFLDECKRGNPIIQDSIMELILGHTIFGIDLHEKTYIFAADNDNAKIYNGSKRDPAQMSRLKNFDFMPTNKEFLADFDARTERGEIHEVISAFLKKNEDFIVLPTKTIEELTIQNKKGPSPRDWTQLGECLLEFKNNDDDIVANINGSTANEMYLQQIAQAYIGSGYSNKFARWCASEFAQQIDINDIVENMTDKLFNILRDEFDKDPKSAIPFCEEVVKNLEKRSKLTEKMGKNILRFMEAMPNAGISNFFQTWNKANPKQFTMWKHTPRRHDICMRSTASTNAKPGEKSAYESWLENFLRRFKLTPADMASDTIDLSTR
jgi:MoxR-like ATPase